MRVIGLISGGKDSIYALMQCVAHGHEVVAVANLQPAHTEMEELDSYMYQTVGHRAVESVAECLGLPLFRHSISGTAIEQGLEYHPKPGDEVEDLFALLQKVMAAIPNIEAVSSGAVFSNYQRNRVENVCGRLGLTSLAYLWERDQAELIADMERDGLEAILVKVACIGLDPQKHLGRTVSAMRPVLQRLHEQYGINVAGEGGEYETLTVDCPLFKSRRLVCTEGRIVVTDEDDGGGASVGHLRFDRVQTAPKS